MARAHENTRIEEQKDMRVLGIDYGAKRVGLALGDTETKIATPWTIIPNEGTVALLARIHEVVLREEIRTIVVGVPRPLARPQSASPQTREVLTFVEAVRRLGTPVTIEDEALSSRLAARQTQEMQKKGKRDDLAAAVILQTWLERGA